MSCRLLAFALCSFLLLSCTSFNNRFNRSQHDCGIVSWRAFADQSLFRIQRSDGTPVRNGARAMFSENGKSTTLTITPGGCVSVPAPARGLLEVTLPAEELGISRLVAGEGRAGDVVPLTLAPVAKLTPEIRCPIQKVVKDPSDVFFLPVTVSGAERSPGTRLFLEVSASDSGESLLLSLQDGPVGSALSNQVPSLRDGIYSIAARAVDLLGRSSSSPPCLIRLDSHVPAAPSHAGVRVIRAGDAFDLFVGQGEHGFLCMEPAEANSSRCLRQENFEPFEKTVRLSQGGLWRIYAYSQSEAGMRSAITTWTMMGDDTPPLVLLQWQNPELEASFSFVRHYGQEFSLAMKSIDDSANTEPPTLTCRVHFPKIPAADQNVECTSGPCSGERLLEFVPCQSPFRFRVSDEHLLWGNEMVVTVRATDAVGRASVASASTWFAKDALESWETRSLDVEGHDPPGVFPLRDWETNAVQDLLVAKGHGAFTLSHGLSDFSFSGEALGVDRARNLWAASGMRDGAQVLIRKNLDTNTEKRWENLITEGAWFSLSSRGEPFVVQLKESENEDVALRLLVLENEEWRVRATFPANDEPIFTRPCLTSNFPCVMDAAGDFWWVANMPGDLFVSQKDGRVLRKRILAEFDPFGTTTFLLPWSNRGGIEVWQQTEGKLQRLEEGTDGFVAVFEVPFEEQVTFIGDSGHGERLVGTDAGRVFLIAEGRMRRLEGIPFRRPEAPSRGDPIAMAARLESGEIWAMSGFGRGLARLRDSRWATYAGKSIGLFEGDSILRAYCTSAASNRIVIESNFRNFFVLNRGSWEMLPSMPTPGRSPMLLPFLDSSERLWVFNDKGDLFRLNLRQKPYTWERRTAPSPWTLSKWTEDPATGVTLFDEGKEYRLEGDTPLQAIEAPFVPRWISLSTSRGLWGWEERRTALRFRPIGGAWQEIPLPRESLSAREQLVLFSLPNGRVGLLNLDKNEAWGLTPDGTWETLTPENEGKWDLPGNRPSALSPISLRRISDSEFWAGGEHGQALFRGVRTGQEWEWQRVHPPLPTRMPPLLGRTQSYHFCPFGTLWIDDDSLSLFLGLERGVRIPGLR